MSLKILVFLVFCLFVKTNCDAFESTLGHIRPQADSDKQRNATLELIKRILPSRYDEFDVIITSDIKLDEKDTFSIQKVENKVIITGNTGVAAATGFNYYLKYFCNCQISWEASQLNLPAVLPDVNITIPLNDRFRYYQNVCTTGYTFVWWDWKQWEQHIDWMVLNSFNLVLAFNGQEAIWSRVYQKLSLTQSDIDEHFSGPAFLPWLRMGNMRGFGGPLSQSWHDRSLYLQKLILDRMRSFGIIPVLPAFAGHLPRAFRSLYPDAKMDKMEAWNRFNDTQCCPYFLDPTETLFNEMGKLFINEQIAEYGTDHVYNCDSFNEVDPSTTDLTYLSNVGKSIYSAMLEADSDAIWVMQGWLFYSSSYWQDAERVKALITSVPQGKMIILDLQSELFPQYERLDQYYGQPYIWCMLHNFGGTIGMFGSVNTINNVPIKARNAENSTMIGVGLTPEGINQNYVIYDLMIESAWRKEPSDLTSWFKNFTTRRYGEYNDFANKAWQILKDGVYNYERSDEYGAHYTIVQKPNLNLPRILWYNVSEFLEGWDNMILASDNLSDSKAFLFDLVDITRQALQLNGDIYYDQIKLAFSNGDLELLKELSSKFDKLFEDLDLVLGSNERFLLGTWIKDAKSCANNSDEEQQYEYNARNQVTLWGPNGQIIDYACKQWSGLVSKYYHPRWNLFNSYLIECLTNNVTFDETFINEKMFNEVEELFTFGTEEFPSEPQGDTIEIVKTIYNSIEYRQNLKYGFS